MVTSVRVENVSVTFPIYDAASRSLKKRIFFASAGGRIRANSGSHRISVVQALDNVSLFLEHGYRVGLVGHNGAGKSTLLRVLAGIYEPTIGIIEVQGNVAPLFDISLGMDPEKTGYENILLRGLFLGLSRKEIRERVDEIAEFSELGDFLDLPIRTYSTGMRMRLAFAISTSIDPDILLLDEGIGAGDAAFMEKANKRLDEFTQKAAIIVLASHSEELIKNMCDRAVLMDRGRVIAQGKTEDILSIYHENRFTADM